MTGPRCAVAGCEFPATNPRCAEPGCDAAPDACARHLIQSGCDSCGTLFCFAHVRACLACSLDPRTPRELTYCSACRASRECDGCGKVSCPTHADLRFCSRCDDKRCAGCSDALICGTCFDAFCAPHAEAEAVACDLCGDLHCARCMPEEKCLTCGGARCGGCMRTSECVDCSASGSSEARRIRRSGFFLPRK